MPMQPADVVRKWFEEVWNKGRTDLIPVHYHEDAIAHGLVDEASTRGPEEFRAFYDSLKAGFPDLHFEIGDVFGDASQAAIRWTATMTHKGDFMGVKPTGRKVKISGISIGQVHNEQIVHSWNNWDRLTLMMEIGLVAPVK